MNFEQRCVVAAPRDWVWAFVLDIPKVAGCVPGVTKVEPDGADRYKGTLGVSMGPIKLNFEGNISVEEQDDENWRATLRSEAAERKIGGGLNAETRLSLLEHGAAETELVINTNATLLGRLGEFGQPLIRKKADDILKEFAKNLQRQASAP